MGQTCSAPVTAAGDDAEIEVSDVARGPPRAYIQARGAMDDRAEAVAVAAKFEEEATAAGAAASEPPLGAPETNCEASQANAQTANDATPGIASGVPPRQRESPPTEEIDAAVEAKRRKQMAQEQLREATIRVEARLKDGPTVVTGTATPVTASGVPPRQREQPPVVAVDKAVEIPVPTLEPSTVAEPDAGGCSPEVVEELKAETSMERYVAVEGGACEDEDGEATGATNASGPTKLGEPRPPPSVPSPASPSASPPASPRASSAAPVEPSPESAIALAGDASPDVAKPIAEVPTDVEDAPPVESASPIGLDGIALETIATDGDADALEESDPYGDKLLWPSLPESGYHQLGDKYSVSELAEPPHDPLQWRDAFAAAGDGTANPDMDKIRGLRALVWLQTEKAIKCALHDPPQLSYPLTRPAPATLPFYGVSHGDSEGEATSAVEVWNMDMLEAASKLYFDEGISTVAVLNMANAYSPGGGFRQGAGAQEENLHRRTDAYRFTEQQAAGLYPLHGDVCHMSTGVTVLRGSEKQGYPFLSNRNMFKICLLSCAALEYPCLTSDRQYADERESKLMETKIASILGAATEARCEAVVLSAFGCGAFANPPEVVAKMFVHQLRCWPFRRVVFSIIDDHNAGKFHNPRGNCIPFKDAFGLT